MSGINGLRPNVDPKQTDENVFKPGQKLSVGNKNEGGFTSLIHPADAFVPGLTQAPDKNTPAQTRNPFANPMSKD